MFSGLGNLGVLPVDPLKVNEIKIGQGQGSVALNIDMKNITMYGLANSRMLNYR